MLANDEEEMSDVRQGLNLLGFRSEVVNWPWAVGHGCDEGGERGA